MIPILPHVSRTLVTVLQPEDVFDRMRGATTRQLLTQNLAPEQVRFTGVVQPERFAISMRVNRPNSFLPIVRGRIEATQSGCLIFMKATLFPSTRVYMVFWLLFVPVAGLIASRQYDSLLLFVAALALDLAVLWIAWANFRIQFRLTMRTLDEVLNSAD
ncbi:MAG TPA: hypothetical protein VF191_02520 [Cyclobacteriaceae bacterium]